MKGCLHCLSFYVFALTLTVHFYYASMLFCQVVEIKLRHLDQVQQAFDLVRESASAQGAIVVATYCQEINDIRGAIEFLLIANKSDESFKLAQDKNLVDIYTSVLGICH